MYLVFDTNNSLNSTDLRHYPQQLLRPSCVPARPKGFERAIALYVIFVTALSCAL